MSSINALDAQSKAQLQAYIQKAVRDGLVATGLGLESSCLSPGNPYLQLHELDLLEGQGGHWEKQ
ncbi:hypothetical protein E4U36_000843 [Claviceps purpurea]|nr:hypothetical protein E4U36_000843 [Claviceps purpurea]